MKIASKLILAITLCLSSVAADSGRALKADKGKKSKAPKTPAPTFPPTPAPTKAPKAPKRGKNKKTKTPKTAAPTAAPVAVEIATTLCVPQSVNCADVAALANADEALKLEYAIPVAAAAGGIDPTTLEVTFSQTPCAAGCASRRGRSLEDTDSVTTDLFTTIGGVPEASAAFLSELIPAALEASQGTITQAIDDGIGASVTSSPAFNSIITNDPNTISPAMVRYLV